MAKKKLRGKKKAMYESLVRQLGVITAAANQVHIDRTTHYLWLRTDDNYRQWIAELPEIAIDFAENALYQQIHKGNITAIIFYLKTKAKRRGYVERHEIQLTNPTSTISKEKLDFEIQRLSRRI